MDFGPCKKCGQPRDGRSPVQGRYAKLCANCRGEVAAAIRAGNGNGRQKEVVPIRSGRVDLVSIAKRAVPAAGRFQKSIERRTAARQEAQAALNEFGSVLREMRDAAQQLANGDRKAAARADAEIENDSEEAA